MMFERWYVGFGAALLVVASLQAPFAHVHSGDLDHHHQDTGFIHTHFEPKHHDSSQPEIETHDDDEATINLDWAPTEAKRITVTYAGPIAVVAPQAPYRSAGIAAEFVARSHSPPQFRLLPARAPPV